ncbi:MAG TPA: hypothetical protein VG477_08115 [Thermoanaerobaculia bacterium]|nr:hypothetical protein [Thermoanaerobaculia bacterium]
MNRLALRFATLLVFVLALAPAASAEQWTAVRYVENAYAVSPEAMDSVLFAKANGWVTLNIYLTNEATGLPLTSATGTQVCNPCTVTFNNYLKFKIHDKIVAAGGFPTSAPYVVAGPIVVTSSVPLANVNLTLFISNYVDGAWNVNFAIDHGKVLP